MQITQIKININQNNKFKSSIHFLNSLPTEMRLTILSILIGVIGGLSAVFFRFLIEAIFQLTFVFPHVYLNIPYLVLLFFVPGLAGLIVGYITQNISIETKGHGIPEIIDAVATKRGNINLKVPIAKMVASAITLGVGGSAGKEGPIAQISGGFGSNLGKFFHLTTDEKRDLILSGVASGISATFNAPLGGVLFALEIIRRDKKSPPLIPLIVSSVVGSTIGLAFLYPDGSRLFVFPKNLSFNSFGNIPIFIILGLLVGVCSVIWIHGFYFIESLFDKIHLSNSLVAGFGAFLVGLIQIILYLLNTAYNLRFPLLFWLRLDVLNPELGVDAVQAINRAFNREMLLDVAIIMLVLSFLATSFTLGSGGSGGIFTPTLFLGVLVGTIFGYLIAPFTTLDIAVLAVLGMAGFFGGAARAPFTAVIMTAEMVGDYLLIVPLMFAVSSSWIIASLLHKNDIFIEKLIRRGVHIEGEYDVFADVIVDEVMIKNVIKVHPKDRLESVIQLMHETNHTGYPVTDETDKLVGIITEHDIESFLTSKKETQNWIVTEVCTKSVISVLNGCPLSAVFKIMVGRGINRLPVVNHDQRLVGWITRSDIMKTYLRLQQHQTMQNYEDKLFESDYITKQFLVKVENQQ